MAGLLIVPGLWPVIDANGTPVSGATINFYEPGTTTPKAVYSDATLATSLGTVLTTNAGGEPTTLAGTVARLWWAADGAAFDVQVTAGASTRTWSSVVVSDSGLISLIPISNITALRAATWPSGRPTQAQVVSNWTTGDGGGVFRWNAASTATDNGGTIIKETAVTTGRWIRQWTGTLFASWFGVREGIDNTATLNAIFADTSVNAVQLPFGELPVTALVINRDNIDVSGFGHATTLMCSSSTADILTIGDGTNERSGVNLSNFDIWASVTKSAGWSLYLRRWTNSEIRNIGVGTIDRYVANSNSHRLYEGVYFDLFSQVGWTGNSEIVCAQRGVAMRGLSASGFGSEIYFDGNLRIYKAGSHGIHVGGDCGGVFINRVDISECATGIQIDKALTALYNREVFIGEQSAIDLATGWGINIEDDSLETGDINCWISGCGNNATGAGGIRIAPTTGVSPAIKASSLRVQSCKYDGVQINAGNINWNGGFCRSNGVGTNGGHGILLASVAAVRSIIQGVSIHNNGNGTRGWGVTVGAACNNFTIADNDLFSNGQGQITNAAGYSPTQVIRNNRGFVTENSGQASILNGNSSVTVTHGCDAVPNFPLITNIGHGNAGPQVQTLTSTTFQIALGAPVGADTQFQWTINAM